MLKKCKCSDYAIVFEKKIVTLPNNLINRQQNEKNSNNDNVHDASVCSSTGQYLGAY